MIFYGIREIILIYVLQFTFYCSKIEILGKIVFFRKGFVNFA